MSRKHFRALAEALKASGADFQTCLAVARVCKDENSRFDYPTFMHACGHNDY